MKTVKNIVCVFLLICIGIYGFNKIDKNEDLPDEDLIVDGNPAVENVVVDSKGNIKQTGTVIDDNGNILENGIVVGYVDSADNHVVTDKYGNVAGVNGAKNDGAIVTDADGNVVEGSGNDYVFVEDDYFDDNGKVTTTGRTDETDKKVTTTDKQVLVSSETTKVTTTTAPLVTTTTYNPSVTTAPEDDIFTPSDDSVIADAGENNYNTSGKTLEELIAMAANGTSCYSEGVDCSLEGVISKEWCTANGNCDEDVWD